MKLRQAKKVFKAIELGLRVRATTELRAMQRIGVAAYWGISIARAKRLVSHYEDIAQGFSKP